MSKKKLLIVILLIIVLALAGYITYFVMQNNKKVETYNFNPGEFFITNVVDSKSLIKTDIVIEITNKDAYEFCTTNQYKVRDIVINIMRNKTFEEIMDGNAQVILKEQIKSTLSTTYALEGIDNVYFNEFVVQQ